MAKFYITYDIENVSIVRIVNFLVSYKVMSLAEAVTSLVPKYNSGETVVIEIQDEELAARFRDDLDSDGWNYRYE